MVELYWKKKTSFLLFIFQIIYDKTTLRFTFSRSKFFDDK